MNQSGKKSVRIYELYPVAELIRLSDQIEKLIIGPYGVNNSNGTVNISNSTGFIKFIDYSNIWTSKNNSILLTPKIDIIRIVENLLDSINSRIQDFNKANKSTLSSFLPNRYQRKLKSCDLVIHREGNWYDHWLCVYELQLSAITSEGDGSFVYGMGIEIRVGNNNKIISLSSNWRPFINVITTDLFPLNEYHFVKDLFHPSEGEDPPEESNQNDQVADGQNKDLVYVFDGEASNQYQLSPYYFVVDEDHIFFYPACKYSLTIRIIQDTKKQETGLIAIVYGGSGFYKFNWAYWNSDTIWNAEGQIVIVGEGEINSVKTEKGVSMSSAISLPPGFCNVLLNVADIKTCAYKQTQQIII